MDEKPIVVKRRGRKRKTPVEPESEVEVKPSASQKGRPRKSLNYYDIANPNVIEDEEKTVLFTPKSFKSDEKPLETSAESSLLELDLNHTNGENSNNLNETTTRKTKNETNRGRKYTYTGETVKMLQTLFTTYKNDNSSPKFLSAQDLDNASGSIICAICKQTIEKASFWPHHKLKYHNNLAWRIGEEPLDLTDQNFVMTTLNALYKKRRPLFCYLCGQSKKSVVGFLSHQSICNKTEEELEDLKTSCEICGKKVMPVSLISHMKIHTNPKPEIIKEQERSFGSEESFSKRTAAKKALQIINDLVKPEEYFAQNITYTENYVQEILENELEETSIIKCKFNNCTFVTNSFEQMTRHLSECEERNRIDQSYTCKKCLQSAPTQKDIEKHLRTAHKIDVRDKDPNFLDDEPQSLGPTPQNSSTVVPSFVKFHQKKNANSLSPCCFQWTLQFFIEYCNEELLFHHYLPKNWSLLPQTEVPKYLPQLPESCQFDEEIVGGYIPPKTFSDYKFKTLELFESHLNSQGTSTTFCGGPITSMAWMPTPFDSSDCEQYLAVATQNSPDSLYLMIKNYYENSVIQFWNVGNLKNSEKPICVPRFSFGLVLDIGPVWHMEWCSSGCYNRDLGRMGLLAVAGSTGSVFIFSIPFPQNEGLFFKPKPLVRLLLKNCSLGKNEYYPTKISWGEAAGHNYIAVGFSNGFVAIYNLNTTSPLLTIRVDDVDCYFPVKYFPAHVHGVTVLNHLSGGCRWLLTGSIDRYLKLWDLNDISCPIWGMKKHVLTDGKWPKNWLCNLIAYDEASTTSMLPSLLCQPCGYLFDHMSLLFSHSTITSISASDWLNGILQGNSVGEISAVFPHQLLHIVDQKCTKAKRLLFGYTSLIRKDEQTKTLSYENAVNNYGLVFYDHRMERHKNFTDAGKKTNFTSLTLQSVKPELYPLQQINKIAFNPNRQASLFYATAYHSGFLRITWMEFLKDDGQIQ